MAASKLNLPIVEKGATYRHTLYWKDSSNLPINLTGCTARLQVRDSVDSEDVTVELNTENSRIIIDELLGKIDLYISDEDTTNLNGFGGVYDMEVYFLNGDTIRLIEGRMSFKPEVTR
jgi:hypothetical protein